MWEALKPHILCMLARTFTQPSNNRLHGADATDKDCGQAPANVAHGARATRGPASPQALPQRLHDALTCHSEEPALAGMQLLAARIVLCAHCWGQAVPGHMHHAVCRTGHSR